MQTAEMTSYIVLCKNNVPEWWIH